MTAFPLLRVLPALFALVVVDGASATKFSERWSANFETSADPVPRARALARISHQASWRERAKARETRPQAPNARRRCREHRRARLGPRTPSPRACSRSQQETGEKCGLNAPTADAPFTVLTFNVLHSAKETPGHEWALRRSRVVEAMRRHDADLIGCQEITPEQFFYLKRHLRGYRVVTYGAFIPVSIFVRVERYELLDHGGFWHSDTPDLPFSGGYGQWLPRASLWARLYDREAKREFLMLNSHFDHESPRARLHAARQFLHVINRRFPDLPVIATADYNDLPAQPAYLLLTTPRKDARVFLDSFAVNPVTGKPACTYHGFDPRDRWRDDYRIDHVLYAGDALEPTAWQVDQQPVRGLMPTDHFPVRAEFRWRKAADD